MKNLTSVAKFALIILLINLVTSAAIAQGTASETTKTQVSDLERQINEQTKNIASHPNEPWPYANRARLYERLGNIDEAFKDFARAIETMPGDEWQFRNRADAYNRHGNVDAAIADYTRAIELNPNFAGAYYDRALMFLKQGKKADAIEELIVSAQIDLTEWNQDIAPIAFEKVIELDPNDFRGHRGLGYTKLYELTQWRDYDVAVAHFDKALSLMPNDLESLTLRGTAYLQWEKYAPAVMDLTKAIQLKPSAELYTLRAEAYEKLGKAVSSAADKKKASTLSPDPAMERAAAARRSGNMELAIQEYTKAIQLGSRKAYRERGKTYMRMGKDDLALADFKEARIWNNEDFDIELGRGEIYARRGDYERALSAYERVALKSNDETVKKFAREKSAEALANVKAQRK